MTRRVLLNSSGLKVSKPGVDVVTTGPGGLQFSSDFSQMTLQTSGEIDCNWNSNSYSAYGFGKTYATPPLVHMQQVISASEMGELSATGFFYWEWRYNWTDLGGASHTAYHVVNTYVTASAIMIQSLYHSTRPSQVTAPPFRLRYTVLDYNV